MPATRAKDPHTSFEAAASVENVTETQWHILQLLKHPLTDQDLVDAYKLLAGAGIAPRASESGIRSRRAELASLGKVKDSGSRIKLESGRRAIVWQAI